MLTVVSLHCIGRENLTSIIIWALKFKVKVICISGYMGAFDNFRNGDVVSTGEKSNRLHGGRLRTCKIEASVGSGTIAVIATWKCLQRGGLTHVA